METIDQRVRKVLVKEKSMKPERNCTCKGFVTNPVDDSIKPEYTLSPKDTIGKSIYFNTVRK